MVPVVGDVGRTNRPRVGPKHVGVQLTLLSFSSTSTDDRTRQNSDKRSPTSVSTQFLRGTPSTPPDPLCLAENPRK